MLTINATPRLLPVAPESPAEQLGFDCFVHGRQVGPETRFCTVCHPTDPREIADERRGHPGARATPARRRPADRGRAVVVDFLGDE